MQIDLWIWNLSIDARALLAWAVTENVEMPADVRDLILGIRSDTASVMIALNQLAPLLAIGDAAEASGTHHGLSARLFRESIHRAFRAKPVQFERPAVKTVKQGALNFD